MFGGFHLRRAPLKGALLLAFAILTSLVHIPLCARANPSDLAVSPIAPESVFTHGEGNIQWIDTPTQATRCTVISGEEVGPEEMGEDGEWAVVLKSTDKATPLEYSTYFDNVLKWLNPLSNTWETMDFEVHLKTSQYFDDVSTFYVGQSEANHILTKGVAECKVWYKIYRHGEDTPMDPGLFTYWCRSLNPGEGVGFVPSDQAGVTLTNAYVTTQGLHGEPFTINDPEHIEGSSVKNLSSDDAIKFMGSEWLLCDGNCIVDVADPGQGWVGKEHQDDATHWNVHTWGDDNKTMSLHEKEIPYSEYIQYRAVTFDVASDGTAKDGICLTYFSEEDKDDGGEYYWEIEFNGILVTRTSPHKTLLTPEDVRPGDDVGYSVSQSLEEMPQSVVHTMSFSDELPPELEFSSAKMIIDDVDVTDSAGELFTDGQTVTYTLNETGVGMLAYGENPSLCTLEIHATVRDGTAPGTTITNVATVDINDDAQETEQVEVHVVGDPAYSLVKDVSTASVKTEDVVDYTLAVQNSGEADGTNVVLTDTPPEGVLINPESVTVSGLEEGTYEVSCEDNVLTLTLPTFAAQASFEVSYQATITATEEGQYINSATVTDDGGRNANDEALVALGNPVLSLNKTVNPQEAYVGDRVAYTIEAQNISEATEATNVVISDLPDPSVAIDPESVTVTDLAEGTPREDAQIEATDQTLAVTLASLQAGSGVKVSYEATILAGATPQSVLLNEASITADELDPVKDVAELTIIDDASNIPPANAAPPTSTPGELLLQKSAHTLAEDGTAQPGDTVSFDVAVTNSSSVPMTHVIVSDPIPQGLYIMGLPQLIDDEGVQIDTANDPDGPRIEVLYETITLSIPELAAGATYHLTFDTYVADDAPAQITNVASASADGYGEVQASADVAIGEPHMPLAAASMPQTDVPPVVTIATTSGAAATTVAVLTALSSHKRRRR